MNASEIAPTEPTTVPTTGASHTVRKPRADDREHAAAHRREEREAGDAVVTLVVGRSASKTSPPNTRVGTRMRTKGNSRSSSTPSGRK